MGTELVARIILLGLCFGYDSRRTSVVTNELTKFADHLISDVCRLHSSWSAGRPFIILAVIWTTRFAWNILRISLNK